jgi:lipopolysaccharide export system protein LptA
MTAALPAAEVQPLAARKNFSAISMLPVGSQLKGVMFPRYDEQHRLIGVLKARAMTLVSDQTIAGETVAIEFFNPDSSPRGRVDLTTALFDQAKGALRAKETVILRSDRINTKGTGLCYAFERGLGFLTGPVITWIQPSTETTMNSNHSTLRNTALIGMSILTLPLSAKPPPTLTTEERAAIEADAASRAPAAGQAATLTQTDLTKDTGDAAEASKAAKGFVAQAGMPVPEEEAISAAAQPLDVKPGPDDTVITCDGGMYFDADEGVVVYLKNVRVKDPRFALTGANELKIFLGKKPDEKPDPTKTKKKPDAQPAPAKTKKNDPLGGGFGSKFGDVERMVATGAVHLVQKQTEAGKAPIEASGALCTYHVKTGQIILSGGYPWVKQGASFMRAKQPNLILRILKTGSFITEGNWEMGGNLEKKR